MIVTMHPSEVVREWERVEPVLQRVLNKYDYGSDADDVLDDIISGRRFMWSINNLEALVIMRFCNLPKFTVLEVQLMAGDNMRNWIDPLHRQLTLYAKSSGCKYIDVFGRKGWTRKLEKYGFKPHSHDVRKAL